jgi:hypothetical protein
VREEHYRTFAKMLRARRGALAPLLSGAQIDAERAETFMVVVEEAMRGHEGLSVDLYRADYGVEPTGDDPWSHLRDGA